MKRYGNYDEFECPTLDDYELINVNIHCFIQTWSTFVWDKKMFILGSF